MTQPASPVIVTGGASGIGASTGQILAEKGFAVVIADVQDDLGESLAAELGARYVHLDVADVESWTSAVRTTEDLLGPLFGLVSCAGVKPEYLIDSTPDTTAFARAIAVNQVGVTLGLQIAGARMREHGRGSIVNIASAAGMSPTQTPDLAYAGTKWAVRGLSRVAARQLGPHGVRVNTVLPGIILTPMIEQIMTTHPERVPALEGTIPLRRLGQPIDIARAAYFFMSELGEYANGAELVIDGGTIA